MRSRRLRLALLLTIAATGQSAAAAADCSLYCRPPDEVERRLREDEFIITSVKAAGGGVMGAQKLGLRFQDGTACEAKWKAASHHAESWNNSPRRESGAYRVQKLFLDPEDELVPPIVARCIPFADYAPVSENPTPTIAGTSCVLGALSGWLENVEVPDHVYDPERFGREPAFAYEFGNLNLLHYLIDHRDSRANNFLVSKEHCDPRIFSIDNGIAFGGVLYNFFTWHFNEIRVPALPKKSIERLRGVKREDLDRLAVFGQLELDTAGVLRHVPATDNLDPDSGTRVYRGVIQVGLTRAEIDAIAHRIEKLLARIDAGEIGEF